MNNFKFIFIIISISFYFLVKCSDKNVPTKSQENHPPKITNLVANPQKLAQGDSSTLTVTATDADGDNITYTWEANGGKFSSTIGQSVTWIAPNSIGNYLIKVTASDGKNTDSKSLTLQVKQFFGTLKVTSSPTGANIIIDQKNTGEKTNKTFQSIAAGKHIIEVLKDGYLSDPDSAVVQIEKDKKVEVHFNLTQTSSIKGYVYFSGTTVPISGVVVSIDDKTFTTGNDGYYIISGIKPGSKELLATKENYDTYRKSITIEEGKTISLSIEMTSGYYTHTLAGRIVNALYQAISGAKIIVLNPDGSSSKLWDTSDNNGNYQIPTVPQGTRKIKFEAENYSSKIVEIFISNSDKYFEVKLEAAKIEPPSDIEIVMNGNDVFIKWREINKPTVLGYNVYYRRDFDIKFKKINNTLNLQ